MNLQYQLFALSYLWPAAAVSLAVAIIYYLASAHPKWWQRLLVASHGILLVLAALYAVAISLWSRGLPGAAAMFPFWIMIALFIVSLFYSLTQYRGQRAFVHFLLLLSLPSALWIWFIGTMTITGDWI